MKIKSAYRNNSHAQSPAEKIAERIAEKIPASEKIPLDDQPAADAVKPPNEAIAEATDEATRRLQHQLRQLQQSEPCSVKQWQHRNVRPLARKRLALWRSQGMGPDEEQFLRANPAMVDNPRLTFLAANEAAQRHERGTDAHRAATRGIFDQLAQAQAQPSAESPEFFRPPPPPEPPSPASYVSAPVSRGEVGGYREPSPGRMTLTPEQRQIAAASGISDVEYAKNLLRLRNGDRQR